MASNWHEDVFFGIHYDQHANARDTVLGRDLTAEHLMERLQLVRPDWVQCDCKGHPGYTSWPTVVGSTSPGVVRDSLRIYRDVTRTLGIRLGVHYSGVIDERAIELHPEWACVNADGVRDTASTCPLSAYTDELMIPQMIEIVDKYDVDGFWVDGENWGSKPCWCDRCRAAFTQATGVEAIPWREGEPEWHTWLAFHRELFVAHVARYADAIHAHKAGCLVCSNWMYSARQPEPVSAPVDYLSGDFSWSWGADRAAIEGRVLDGRDKTWDLMAWGFTKTGEMRGEMPWTFKPVTHLCQEVSEVVALGGAVMVYNTPQRSGWLTGWQQERIAEVAAFCRARQSTCWRSRTVPQAAVLHLPGHFYRANVPLYNLGTGMDPVEGALHVLLETQRSTDILTPGPALDRLNAYPLVVVPEQTRLEQGLVDALEGHARAGGCVVLSGAHLAHEYPALVGAQPAGAAIEGTVYLAAGEAAAGVPGPWQPVTPDAGVEAWAQRLAQPDPERGATEDVLVTRRRLGKGSIVGMHGPAFRQYRQGHYPLLRRFVARLVARLDIPWLVTAEAPAWLELILRQQEECLLINLVNRGAGETLHAERVIVTDLPPVRDVHLAIRRASAPHSVALVPDGGEVVWQYGDGVVRVTVPEVAIHSVVVVD